MPSKPSGAELPLHPVREQGTLYSRIAAEIERLIDSQRLRPGVRLPSERELAQRLGVSRPSVREAIKTLAAMGRLRVQHGTGVWIERPDALRQLTSAEVGLRELFAMREVLEVPAAGWAAACAGRAEVERLRSHLDAMEGCGDVEELHRCDVEFHLLVAGIAGNRFLVRTMGVLHEMLTEAMETTLTIPGRIRRSRTEHRRIVDAIARGDAARARRAMRHHIRTAQAAGLERLAQEGLAAH